MNLHFFSPIYLLGLLGITLPILIHLLARHEQTHIKFSAVYLLLQSQKQSIKRSRPNRLILLLIRCLAIVCLSLALAHPIFSLGTDDMIASRPSANVIILDDSFSMRVQSGDASLFARAVQVALEILNGLSKESPVSLILTSKLGTTKGGWTQDITMLRKRLELLQPSFNSTNIASAFSKAFLFLETVPQENKRIFLLTDLDQNGWNQEDFENLKKTDQFISIKIFDFSTRQTGLNQAVVELVDVGQEFLSNSRFIKIKTRVRNLLEGRSLRNFRVSLWINGQKRGDTFLDIPPQSVDQKEFSLPLESGENISGFVEIEKDALAADNRRFFTFQPARQLRVLVVDGDPKAVAHQSETFYLERALNPFYSAASDIDPTVSTLTELPSRNLSDYSVILLCNVRELPLGYEMELEKFVFRGGALFISLGDQVDAKFYNEKMGNLLPIRLESLNQIKNHKESFHFHFAAATHPVLVAFNAKILKEMETIPFHSVYSITPRVEHSINAPVRFKNQYPAIVEAEFGRGKVILFVSTIDCDWNDFAIQPTFLPWIQRWVKYAASGLESIRLPKLVIGQTFQLEPEWKDPTYVKTPEGPFYAMEWEKNGTRRKFEKTGRPGVYQVSRTPLPTASHADGLEKRFVLSSAAEPIGNFAVNIDPVESNPGKIDENAIRKMLLGMRVSIGTETDFSTGVGNTSETPLSTPVLLLVALALFYEGWLVRRE